MPLNPFIYPRTCSVYRANSELSATGGAGAGQQSQPGSSGTYWGSDSAVTTDPAAAGEMLIQGNIPCSQQGTSGKAAGGGGLPADAPGPSRWKFYIPLASCPKGTIKVDDVIVDDEGQRYQVTTNYWNSLGWRVEAIMLKN